ncbi:MAG: hypothetical protein OEY28_14530 [Nitrospira sp.]|nr:hypothetical protein [Nitrospira sp.]
MKVITALFLLSILAAGCGSSANRYSLDEWGDGWKLQVEEMKDRSFKAKWVVGENRSVKILNYDDTDDRGFVRINTLYLELDTDGKVVEGRLKRVVMPEFERAHYVDGDAEWFKVVNGTCILDEEGAGTIDVTCRGGYVFKGDVTPADDLKRIDPEDVKKK